jgi:IS30 family transposase
MYKHLKPEQRYQLEALLSAGHTQRFIATQLNVHPSTISRELKRNGSNAARSPGLYKAANAQVYAGHRAYTPPFLKTHDGAIGRRITWLLKRGWSPQQISAACLARGVPMLSTEAIYLWIYQKKQQGTDYTHWLRRHHRKRRKRRLDKQPRVIIKNKVSIHDRPQVACGTRTGDLETDLIKCKGGYVLTITDRATLYNVIAKVPNKEAATVKDALTQTLRPFINLHTITSDNGTEFTLHQQVASALNVQWFFADPYTPQQRGCNENQNGLLRQYLTRKTNLDDLSEQDLMDIQNKLNHRPRKKLNYQSPVKLFLPHHIALVA